MQGFSLLSENCWNEFVISYSMVISRVRRFALGAGLFCVLLPSETGYCVLGGSAASVKTDQLRMNGSMAAENHGDYTVDQITTPYGTVVNEYISNGTVFAVSWRGPRPPDLSQLLGSYFAEYKAAAGQPHQARRRLMVKTQQLVVEADGHMRDLHGRAYVPALLPSGFTASDIQ
jgi:hypothetical protein